MSLENSVTSSAENETRQSRESEIAKVEDGIKGDLGDLRGNVETMTRRGFLEKTAKVIGAAALSQVPFLGKEAQAQSGQKTQEILLADSGQVATDAGGSRARETREVLRANEVDLTDKITTPNSYTDQFKAMGLRLRLDVMPGYTVEQAKEVLGYFRDNKTLHVRFFGDTIAVTFLGPMGIAEGGGYTIVDSETGKISNEDGNEFFRRLMSKGARRMGYKNVPQSEIDRMTKPSVGSNAIKETVKQRQTVSLEEMVEKARDLGKLKSSESKAVVDKTVIFVKEEARRAISGSNRFDDKVFTQVKQIEYHLRQNGYKAEASDLSSRLSKISEAVRMAERTRDLKFKFSVTGENNTMTEEDLKESGERLRDILAVHTNSMSDMLGSFSIKDRENINETIKILKGVIETMLGKKESKNIDKVVQNTNGYRDKMEKKFQLMINDMSHIFTSTLLAYK